MSNRNELLNKLADKHGYTDKMGNVSGLFEHFESGFDAGVLAECERLEAIGVEGADVKMIQKGSFGFLVVKDEKGNEVWNSKPVKHIELLPVLAQLDKKDREIAELKAQLEKAERVVRFYADKENWFKDHCHKTGFSQNYAASIYYEDIEDHEVGGKTARQYFKDKGEV